MHTAFEDDCSAAVTSLSAALIDLYDSIQADPHRPQDAARQFGINKTLTWNIAKLLQADQPLEAAVHVPGTSSLERMLKAVSKHGATTEKINRVRDAVRSFDHAVEVHVGDRSDLELLLDSMGNRKADGLELSRKLSFRGNSGVYGIQAKTRLSSIFLAPNADDPSMLDSATVSSFTALRRLRASVRWPIFRLVTWGGGDHELDPHAWQPLDGSVKTPTSVGLLDQFSNQNGSTLVMQDSPTGLECILEPGPIGNLNAIDIVRGHRKSAFAPRFSAPARTYEEFGVAITTPCQYLVFDLFMHEDIATLEQAQAMVFAKIFSQGDTVLEPQDQSVLPIALEPVRIAGKPPAVATALVPGYADLFAYVGQQTGWDLGRFRGIRLQMKYPPLGSTVMMRFPLEA
ncbi:MAG: hypothetical protein ACE37H_03475 [Phycisphaeraceae bacterium]